jgi:hypothetical protein
MSFFKSQEFLLEFGTWDFVFFIWILEFEIWNLFRALKYHQRYNSR